MKLSLNWIRDFIELDEDLSNEKLVETITLSVCEVEAFEVTGEHLTQVRVAEVKKIEPHPEADKLTLVEIDTAEDTKTIVCGAKNFQLGDKVAFAGVGTVLPGDFKIKKAKIRGVESLGMLCAEDELGLGEDHEGLLILPPESKTGTTLAELYPDQLDVIMEIDNKSITHRPDLWGHYGFARELGTIFKKPVKPLPSNPSKLKGTGQRLTEVEVLAKDLVPRFSGLSIDKVEAVPSPDWIRFRLNRVGLRPINNLVDLTNYVMLELGQPMHAFDAKQIAGDKLVVRLAEPGCKVMTLHKKEAELTPQDLTICDRNGASVVAGVVGGMDSGVTNQSTSLFLEAANWNPAAIRKTSVRIGLRTDASQRYEKALDPELTVYAIARAVDLLRLSNPGLEIKGDLVDIQGKPIEPITIKTSFDFIQRRLGKKIDPEEIIDILTRLGFEITTKGDDFSAEVPTHRRTHDVSIPEDLVEEVGRIHGFNNIPPDAPFFPIENPIFNRKRQFENQVREALSRLGYHEAYCYPMTNQADEEKFGLDQTDTMKLINPVSDLHDRMRTSLLPNFCETIHQNQKISFDFRMFEIGRIYRKITESEIEEPHRLIAGVSKTKKEAGAAFYELKSGLKNILAKLQLPQIRFEALPEEQDKPYRHKYISAKILSNQTEIGCLYSFSPRYAKRLEIREDVCIAELDMEKMYEIEKAEYRHQSPPKYPSVFFELSLILDKRVYFQEIEDYVYGLDKKVVKVDFLDVFYPPEAQDKKSMSVRIELRSKDKTLEPEEIKNLQDKIIEKLSRKGFHLREN